MDLTIAQLAAAVGRTENYVRQHINRQHLNARRDGRNVSVDIDEAIRWAKDRRLSLTLPANVTTPMRYAQSRAARMAVLTWRQENSKPINLFTHVRHRHPETLGPWAGNPDGTWSSESVLLEYAGESEEFRLHVMDAPYGLCQAFLTDILEKGVLEVDDAEVQYSIGRFPRHHWAYRDHCQGAEHSVSSPFTNHSAEITEYWSFEDGPRERWLKLAAFVATKSEPLLKSLGFPLERRPDRVGNLMIAGAEDAIRCELEARGRTLVLSAEGMDGCELPPDEYTAALWAGHSSDDVVRCEMPVAGRETLIDLPSEVDRIGFAIYRNDDGQCIDYFEAYLLMGVSFEMNIKAGPTLELSDRRRPKSQRLNPWTSRSMLHIEPGKDSSEMDNQIRREVLSRRSFERDIGAHGERNFARFGPNQFEEATDFFLGLLRRHSDSTRPIYLADPYFMAIGPKDEESELYIRIFEATTGNPLRILSSPKRRTKPGDVWWSRYPAFLTKHVIVRELIAPGEHDSAFHDRYLITGDSEILLSNSFTGWRKDGVTFVGIPEGAYRAEAERWWAQGIGTTQDGILVCEVN